ncbi:helix-turn-helix domain-containing protein [Streptomyces virginiae]|uniref:helix-turn-helix domain-containing protein n=1 Tax=Streptomyces virginiae TaxID=1961 RepID=UPI003451ECC6
MVGEARRVNRAQLGAALRALRQASGKEAKSVARSAVMSASKLSKIETAGTDASFPSWAMDELYPWRGGGLHVDHARDGVMPPTRLNAQSMKRPPLRLDATGASGLELTSFACRPSGLEG